jgi:hypothetical protein
MIDFSKIDSKKRVRGASKDGGGAWGDVVYNGAIAHCARMLQLFKRLQTGR